MTTRGVRGHWAGGDLIRGRALFPVPTSQNQGSENGAWSQLGVTLGNPRSWPSPWEQGEVAVHARAKVTRAAGPVLQTHRYGTTDSV